MNCNGDTIFIDMQRIFNRQQRHFNDHRSTILRNASCRILSLFLSFSSHFVSFRGDRVARRANFTGNFESFIDPYLDAAIPCVIYLGRWRRPSRWVGGPWQGRRKAKVDLANSVAPYLHSSCAFFFLSTVQVFPFRDPYRSLTVTRLPVKLLSLR